jgi:hypothetical protein
MSLTETLTADATFRAEAERKASHLHSMTAAEIASLSDERLDILRHEALLARLFEECDDAAHPTSSPYWERLARYRALESAASVEIEARSSKLDRFHQAMLARGAA